MKSCFCVSYTDKISWQPKFSIWRPKFFCLVASWLPNEKVNFEPCYLKVLRTLFSFFAEIKAVAALLGVSGVSLYRGLTTKTKNVRGQILRSLCDSATVSIKLNENKQTYCLPVYSKI